MNAVEQRDGPERVFQSDRHVVPRVEHRLRADAVQRQALQLLQSPPRLGQRARRRIGQLGGVEDRERGAFGGDDGFGHAGGKFYGRARTIPAQIAYIGVCAFH